MAKRKNMGTKSTLAHDMFQVNAFHTEMVTGLGLLKRQPRRRRFVIASDAIPPEESREGLDISSVLQEIRQLDELISEKSSLYQTMKDERKITQEEMCSTIKDSEISPAHSKRSEIFLHLCNFENTDEHDKDNCANNKCSDHPSKIQKKSEKPDKDFVTRNIELAKEHSMAQFSLTDEEKVKLDSLLSDIDSEDYAVDFNQVEVPATKELKCSKNRTKRSKAADENKNGDVNYFHLNLEDLTSLKDLEVKLTEILESYDENDKDWKLKLDSNNDGEDILETADKEGRYWKHHQTQQRLENIEKDLADIAVKEAEEQKKLESMNQKCFEENDILGDYEDGLKQE